MDMEDMEGMVMLDMEGMEDIWVDMEHIMVDMECNLMVIKALLVADMELILAMKISVTVT